MKEIKLSPEKLPQLLSEYIKDKNCIFIYPTDTAMNSWIEFLIINPELSGTDAIPLERFIAWDNFKGKYLRAEENGKKAIPSILRKLFVLDLISRNSSKPKEQRFQVIINPDDKYTAGAVSFSDWICKNLPSLHFWKKRMDEHTATYGEMDAEDKDYMTLYTEYKAFLDSNNLYEPSWIESLALGNKDNTFIILYPELLEDFGDFSDVFSSSNNITVITMPQNIPAPPVYLYPDSRSELRQTMLRIIEIVKSGKADWSEIALSVPNIEIYRPYLEREFQIYEIPYVIKSGLSLTQNSAGKIFKEISDCYNDNFSFNTIRALILDEYVPWKSSLADLREELIRVGNEMRCICSPGEKDIWLSALQSQINRVQKDEEKVKYYTDLKDFYSKLKYHVELFYKSINFEQVNEAWQKFKFFFLEDDGAFSSQANAVLGRCISELKEISQIEKDFTDCGITINSPFDFFLSEIEKKKYTPQQKTKTGVNIFPYRLSGPAYFKYQFVIDASQKNLDVPFKRLTFLNATKRNKLHLLEDDKKVQASEVFIKLYAKKLNDDGNFVVFSAAESTFNGFAIPHNLLTVIKKQNDKGKLVPYTPNLDSKDYIKQEHDFILNSETAKVPEALTASQKELFSLWCTKGYNTEEPYHINEKIKQNLQQLLINNRKGKSIINNEEISDSKIKISARGDLEKFFPCPRKWMLSTVLKLREDTLDTSLMQSYDMGNLNHKVLELFILNFKNQTLPFYDENSDCFKIAVPSEGVINPEPEPYIIDLIPFIEKAIKSMKFNNCPLVTSSLTDQKNKLADNIIIFLKFLLKPYGLLKTPKTTSMNGIGNCRVIGCEETLTLCKDNFDYFGKIDCLLLTPGPKNNWIIIDYKNSEGAMPANKDISVNENGILNDFQMSLYFKLVNEENKHPIAAGYFYAIKDAGRRKVVDILSEVTQKDPNDKNKKDPVTVKNSTFEKFSPTMHSLEKYAEAFAEKVNPDSELNDFSPYTSSSENDILNVKAFEHCIECNFKSICRTTYNVGRKEITKKTSDTSGE